MFITTIRSLVYGAGERVSSNHSCKINGRVEIFGANWRLEFALAIADFGSGAVHCWLMAWCAQRTISLPISAMTRVMVRAANRRGHVTWHGALRAPSQHLLPRCFNPFTMTGRILLFSACFAA